MIKKLLNIRKAGTINASTNIEDSTVSETAAGSELEINTDEADEVDASTNIKGSKVASNTALIAFVIITSLAGIAYSVARMYFFIDDNTAIETVAEPQAESEIPITPIDSLH